MHTARTRNTLAAAILAFGCSTAAFGQQTTGQTAPGQNSFGDDIRLRIGAGYDVVQGPVTLTPRIALDFGNGRENLVLGATAYFRF